MAITIKNGEITCIKFGDGPIERKMRAGYQRVKKMTMEQALEEGKRKEREKNALKFKTAIKEK